MRYVYCESRFQGFKLACITILALGLSAGCSVRINLMPKGSGGLAISPAAATLVVGNQKVFSGSGGIPPYTFTVLGTQGTVQTASGVYSAPATPESGGAIQIRDSAGNTAYAVVTIVAAPQISPAALTLLTGESSTLTPSGGVPAFTFSDSGSGNVNAQSGLYTAPLSSSPMTETVSATDSIGNVAQAAIKIRAFQTKDLYSSPTVVTAVNYPTWADWVTRSTGLGLFAGGAAKDMTSNAHWITYQSTNGGTSWSKVDNFALSAQTSESLGSAVDSGGNLYAVGYAKLNGVEHWIVRKSTDGTTWSTVSDFNLATGWNARATAAAASGTVIYVTGYGTDTSGISHTLVRKSADGGVTWSTTLDYTYGGANTQPGGMASDANGYLFVTASSGIHWLALKSLDNGASWALSDDFVYSATKTSKAYQIAAAPGASGVLYATGYGMDASNVNHWVVRKSTDHGGTWSTVDDFNFVAGNYSGAEGVYADSAGAIYVHGTVGNAGNNYWATRKSTDAGATWTTVMSNYASTASNACDGSSVVSDGAGNVWAAGYVSDGGNVSHMIIRKSADSGATWSVTSDLQNQTSANAQAVSITSDPNGVIWAAGNNIDANNVTHGVVRKSTDNGVTWTQSDDYQYNVTKNTTWMAIAAADANNIYVVGYAIDASNFQHWLVRKTANGGASWTTPVDYVYTANKNSAALSLLIDTTGGPDIYVGGRGVDASNTGHVVIRKSTDAGATWSTFVDYSYVVGQSSFLYAMAKSGNRFVYAFQGNASASSYHWVVRGTSDGGTTWNTLEDYQYNTAAFVSNTPYSALVDSAGVIHVTGIVSSAGGSRWIIRRSPDFGATWSNVADFTQTYSSGGSTGYSLLKDTDGSLYSSGNFYDPVLGYSSGVARSTNGGLTWTVVDQTYGGGTASAQSLSICPGNRICVTGTRTNYFSVSSWLTRILSP